MKKIFTVIALLLCGLMDSMQPASAAIYSLPQQHLTKSGKPDKRYSEDKHLKKDGTIDRRYKSSKKAVAVKKQNGGTR